MQNAVITKSILFSVFLALTWSLQARADTVLDGMPGFIPLQPGLSSPASDLVYQGKKLQPDQVTELGKQGIDISTLEPSTDNDIYNGTNNFSVNADSTAQMKAIGLDPSQAVRYFDFNTSRSGNFRFSASQAQGLFRAQKNFTFFASGNAHTILLRKAFLEKLGYHVPPIARVPEIRVQFNNPGARDSFLQRMHDTTYGEVLKRWAKLPNDDSYDLILNDVLVMSNQAEIYNLALGYLTTGIINDFRMFRSMAALYELLNWDESVNSLYWTYSRIVSNNLVLNFKDADNFVGNYEDARWMASKVAKLTRQDFVEAVAKTDTPDAVQKSLVERLLSRRNEMINIFKINAAKIAFNPDISELPDLVKGKLTREDWPGYGSRFSLSDPESPFSKGEGINFLKSKVLANLISVCIGYLNNHALPNTIEAVAQAASDAYTGALQKQIVEFLKTKKWQKIPISAWAKATYGINVITARDVVIGSYMGSENKVQLVDSIGLNFNLGAHIGVTGIPTPWNVAVLPNASFTRTYAHLRPINSVKSALRYPFKNIVVPLLEKKDANLIDQIVQTIPDKDPSSEQLESIKAAVNSFKDNLGIGESIVITDSVGPSLAIQAGANPTKLTGLYASVTAQQLFLSRTHIFRSDENTIQVYKDLGRESKLRLAVTLKAFIPIITISGLHNNGMAKTKFYSVNIKPDLDMNPKLKSNLVDLKQVITSNSFEALEADQKPYQFKTDFSQSRADFTLLFFRAAALDSLQTIDVTKPASDDLPESTHSYIRRTLGKMHGNNFSTVINNSINATIGELSKNSDVFLNAAETDRPSDSTFGDSVIRSVSLDASINSDKKISEPFVVINTTWAGWRASQNKLKKILAIIAKKFGQSTFPEIGLHDTAHIDLYQVEMYYNIYGEGIAYFLYLPSDMIKDIFEKYKTRPLIEQKPDTGPHNQHDQIVRYHNVYVPDLVQELFAKLNASKDTNEYTENLLKLISFSESYLSKDGVFALFGGEQNVLAGSKITGFRSGDEQGDKALISNSLGEFGSPKISGPIEEVRALTGSSGTEFYIFWLMERL